VILEEFMEQAVKTKTMPRQAQTMNKKVVNSYVSNHLMGLSQGQLLLTVYDIAITSCQQQDNSKAIRAVSELISALNFEYQEISVGLFRIYQYVIDKIREKDYNDALFMLRELRDAWATALASFN
jgi:flagellin-specific chaperone FliS